MNSNRGTGKVRDDVEEINLLSLVNLARGVYVMSEHV